MTSDTYQKQIPTKEGKWNSSQIGTFEFEIEDTTHLYNPCILLRHDDNYSFNNIWLKVYVQHPNQEQFTDSFQIELTLADREGYWLGNQSGDFWNHKITLISKKFNNFKEKGTYKIGVKHLMRQDPLLGIFNIGWRMEKLKP